LMASATALKYQPRVIHAANREQSENDCKILTCGQLTGQIVSATASQLECIRYGGKVPELAAAWTADKALSEPTLQVGRVHV
jgi:hypothetical protein